ncbi:MAG: methyltransferase domain-containing protein [Sedimentisphaerales bacterium]|nr:methyltransferase domain-containing protein [Sedimentisphaerales bacterium]
MRTRISSDNPYRHDRWGFAWECVASGNSAHLDFGCNEGHFLSSLKSKQIGRLVGVDASSEAIARGKKLYDDIELIHVSAAASLPFGDGTFDSITIMDVIEHIFKQHELLSELRRVLKNDGTLIVTVPGQHAFSFLDMGNFKFRFPRLHKWYYSLRHSPEEYDRRYASNPDGLVGDVSAEKRWHEHFSRNKLGKVLEISGFKVINFDGAGFFGRFIIPAEHLFRRLRPVMKVILWLREVDAKAFESMNLFCKAEKRIARQDAEQSR